MPVINKVFSITVFYNPRNDVLTGLASCRDQVEEMVIVDNSEYLNLKLHNYIEKHFTNSCLIVNGKNLGIAKALNQGLEYAIKEGFEYALLMDQDSELFPEAVEKLRQCLDSDERIFIASPRRIDVNSAPIKNISTRYMRKLTCATSGSLLRLKHVKEVGYHDEKLFIDMVDHECCLRAVSRGLHVVIVNDAFMRHRLGMMCRKKILWINFYPTNHSALRRYYKARNSLYVWRKYAFKYPRYVLPAIANFIIEYLEILLFEDAKLEKTRAVLTGFWDCIRQRFGKKEDSFMRVRG